MGVDLILLTPDRDKSTRSSYGGFMRFRRRVAESAGYGALDDYRGFGGDRDWPEGDPLVALLHHSDCDGQIWARDAEGLGERLRILVEQWEPSPDREFGLEVAALFEALEESWGVVDFR